jgi:hypothetical protein
MPLNFLVIFSKQPGRKSVRLSPHLSGAIRRLVVRRIIEVNLGIRYSVKIILLLDYGITLDTK